MRRREGLKRLRSKAKQGALMQTKQLHKTILILEEVWAVMMSMTLILVT
jgi:hypothetical protein